MQKRVPKTNRPRKVCGRFAGHICGESFGTKFHLHYRIGNCDEGANVSLFWMADPDCVLQKLRNGKDGFVAEMLKYARVETKQYSLGLFMDMVKAYHLESSRCHSSFAVQTGEGSKTILSVRKWVPKSVPRYYTCGHATIGFRNIANSLPINVVLR